jgi:hypothetical protein
MNDFFETSAPFVVTREMPCIRMRVGADAVLHSDRSAADPWLTLPAFGAGKASELLGVMRQGVGAAKGSFRSPDVPAGAVRPRNYFSRPPTLSVCIVRDVRPPVMMNGWSSH